MLGLFSKTRVKAHCAFCKSERHVNRKKNLDLMDYLTAGICSFMAMAAIFQEADPRVFIFFIFFIAIGELFVQFRWRIGVVCPHCGFDPVLYLKSPETAAAQVTSKLEQRKSNPEMLLARKLDIPYRKVPAGSVAKKKPEPEL